MPTSRLLRRTKKTRTILVRPNRTSCPLFSLLGFPPYSTPTNKGGIRLTVHVDVAVAVDVQVQTALRGAAPISLGGVISATGSRLLYSQRVRLVRGTAAERHGYGYGHGYGYSKLTATATAKSNLRPRLPAAGKLWSRPARITAVAGWLSRYDTASHVLRSTVQYGFYSEHSGYQYSSTI